LRPGFANTYARFINHLKKKFPPWHTFTFSQLRKRENETIGRIPVRREISAPIGSGFLQINFAGFAIGWDIVDRTYRNEQGAVSDPVATLGEKL